MKSSRPQGVPDKARIPERGKADIGPKTAHDLTDALCEHCQELLAQATAGQPGKAILLSQFVNMVCIMDLCQQCRDGINDSLKDSKVVDG